MTDIYLYPVSGRHYRVVLGSPTGEVLAERVTNPEPVAAKALRDRGITGTFRTFGPTDDGRWMHRLTYTPKEASTALKLEQFARLVRHVEVALREAMPDDPEEALEFLHEVQNDI